MNIFLTCIWQDKLDFVSQVHFGIQGNRPQIILNPTYQLLLGGGDFIPPYIYWVHSNPSHVNVTIGLQ